MLPVVSAISGNLYPEGSDAPDRIRALWIRHAAAPIDFVSAVRCAAAPTPSGAQARLFIQVGAGNSLLAFVKASLAEQTGTSRATMASREEDGLASLATAVGLLWAAGNPIDFGPLFEGREARQLTLPPTPLETQQYWVIEKSRKEAEPLALVLEGAREQPGFADLAKVLLISILGIYGALLLQFGNAVKPFLVLATTPYGVMGALICLAIMGTPFGFMAFLGIASLIGVIVSHVIVLFDFIEELHEKGEPFEQAIRDAGIERLRPVLITVCATILALFPLASHGGPLWQPLCYAQIGGLAVATFITLLLVPVLYSIAVLDLKIVKWETKTSEGA